MNPASKSSLPVITDPVIAAMVAQLKQENALYKQSISIYEMKVQKLEQETSSGADSEVWQVQREAL